MRRSHLSLIALVLAAGLLGWLAVTASSHPERPTSFPEVNGLPPVVPVPELRSSGPYVVVCKSDSAARLAAEYGVRLPSKKAARRRRHHHHRRHRARHRRRPVFTARYGARSSQAGPAEYQQRVALLSQCRFHDIQAAVNASASNYRILIMPGLYQEIPSRMQPEGSYQQGPCANDYALTEGFNDAPPPVGPRSNDPPVRPDRNLQVKCPNAKNLIEVVGDTRPEPDAQHPGLPQCIQLCNLQIEGMGRGPGDVLIQGDRKRLDVLRIDRASGVVLHNFTVEQAAFNNIDIVEVSGFRVQDVVVRYGQDYGVLSFTATNGLYDHVTAYGNGDSGIYPGSTEKGCDVAPNAYGTCGQRANSVQGGCDRYSIEIRNSDSYGNTLGYSGTAGNSTWVHDNRFHDNATGLATDSFAQGHPGMPQECVKWENNQIYSNNNNVFSTDRQDYCNRTPFLMRQADIVCPQFQTAVGTGVLIAGGNRNLIRNNRFYDNWRWGVLLFGVPATLRNDNDPAHQQDTSNGNQFLNNVMGQAPDGSRSANGEDFRWDSQGAGNCFEGNSSMSGPGHTSTPPLLPACPGSPIVQPANPAVIAPLTPCAAWDPHKNPQPIGCDWFTTPAKPQ
ncbi:MAG: hypothetical protein NVSMB25_15060 [Thermoleophilaceae bacterium]